MDLQGVGGLAGTIRVQAKAAVASATTQFHWQDPSLSTECSRCEIVSDKKGNRCRSEREIQNLSYPINLFTILELNYTLFVFLWILRL